MGWRKILEAEHDLILEVIDDAEREARIIDETGAPRLDQIADIMEFFQYFNEAMHDPKEEDMLYARCAKRGMSTRVGPLEHMLGEHEWCRAQVRGLRQALANAREHPGPESAADLSIRIKAYAQLIRRHTADEEEHFFDFAQQYLTAEDRKELSEEFESAHFEEVQEGAVEHFEALARKLRTDD